MSTDVENTMKTDLQHYILLADLFRYPDAEFAGRVNRVQGILDERYPAAGTALRDFTDYANKATLLELEELYIRSFDVQAVTTLDIGYVLFGDDYKRGELLSNLNREHVAAHVDCGHELADHLPNVLKLLARLEDEELVNELVKQIIAPALNKMIDEFDSDRILKKNESYAKHYKTLIDTPVGTEAMTLYKHALNSLFEVVSDDFGIARQIPVVMTSDFLKNIATENEIEEKAQSFY